MSNYHVSNIVWPNTGLQQNNYFFYASWHVFSRINELSIYLIYGINSQKKQIKKDNNNRIPHLVLRNLNNNRSLVKRVGSLSSFDSNYVCYFIYNFLLQLHR